MFKLLISLVLLAPAVANAGVISVRWTHENPASVAGYRIYYGTGSDVFPRPPYPNMINVSSIQPDSQGVYTYKFLVPDDVTFVVVTAYNSAGESDFSNEGTFVPVGKPGAPIILIPTEN